MTISNESGWNCNGIADSERYLIPKGTGVIGVGYFDIDDDAISNANSIQTIVSAFHQAGETSTFGGDFPDNSIPGNPGRYTFTTELDIEDGSHFIGENVYLFIGNGDSFSESTELLVYKFNAAYFWPDEGTPSVYLTQNSYGELLVGSTGYTSGQSYGGYAQFRLAAMPIPEPTSMSLLALGGIALIRRRRG